MLRDFNNTPIQIARWVGDPQIINLSVVSASVPLQVMTAYRLWASVNAFFVLGAPGVLATTLSNPLTGGLDALIVTDGTNTTLAGIVAAGTGVLYISRLDAVSV